MMDPEDMHREIFELEIRVNDLERQYDELLKRLNNILENESDSKD